MKLIQLLGEEKLLCNIILEKLMKILEILEKLLKILKKLLISKQRALS